MALRKEHRTSLAQLEKYTILNTKNDILPPKRRLIIESKYRDPDSYVYQMDPEQQQVQCTSRHNLNDAHVIHLNRDDKDCGYGCLSKTSYYCSHALAYFERNNIPLQHVYPKKYTVEGGFRVSELMIAENNSPLPPLEHWSSLSPSVPPIVGPDVRKPKGYGRTKKKRYVPEERLRNQALRRQQDDRNAHPNTAGGRRFRIQKCSACGGVGHNARKCIVAHDWMGNVMTTQEQNERLEKGFLWIRISNRIGGTKWPQSLDEYNTMRLNSPFTTRSFKYVRAENERTVVYEQSSSNSDDSSSGSIEEKHAIDTRDNLHSGIENDTIEVGSNERENNASHLPENAQVDNDTFEIEHIIQIKKKVRRKKKQWMCLIK